MGTWGVGILDDDVAAGVYELYLDRYDDGMGHPAIRASLIEDHAAEIADEDDGPVFWLALARAQWECGALDADVRDRIAEIVGDESVLERWEDGDFAGPRRAILRRFLRTLQTPRTRPRPRRKTRFIPAPYQPGDCLAFVLPGGDWGAALVLAADNSGRRAGKNLVGVLRYKAPEKPGTEIFESRDWLRLTHHAYRGQPEINWHTADDHKTTGGAALETVGRIALRPDDPQNSNSWTGWNLGLQVELQDRWDRGSRD